MAVTATGCAGEIADPFGMAAGGAPGSPQTPGAPGTPGTPADPSSPVDPTAPAPVVTPKVGLRRLSKAELSSSLQELLGVAVDLSTVPNDGIGGASLDQSFSFDNRYEDQEPSRELIESLETAINDSLAKVLADSAKKTAFLGCTPSGTTDSTCLCGFTQRLARRALKRPLQQADQALCTEAMSWATRANDFNAAVSWVTRVLLLDVEFIYRVEAGTTLADGQRTLTPHELASRLSYFITGALPPVWLLDLADQNQLSTPAQIESATARLWSDAKGMAQVQRFHSMWLGYQGLQDSVEISKAMRTETAELVKRSVYDSKYDYSNLLLSPETYVNDTLISQYGLTAAAATGYRWVPYGTGKRGGVLSHGSVLTNGSKLGNTSPTLRGLYVQNRLLCRDVGAPPPGVNADAPPQASDGSPCKAPRFATHATSPTCAGCHQFMDPVGFGLEQFDSGGAMHTTEPGLPQCSVSGDGELAGFGTFNGPKELGQKIAALPEFDRCVTRQTFQFAFGRRAEAQDQGLLNELTAAYVASGRQFGTLWQKLAAHPTFAQRAF